MTGIDKLGNFTQTATMMNHVKEQAHKNRFDDLIKQAQGSVSSEQVAKDGKLNGDVKTGFSGTYSLESDKTAVPSGMAARNAAIGGKTIDKTSQLYEKSMELESFFVKMMMDSMRKTLPKHEGGNSFAQNMYEDMLYDEYTTALTKNAGFGIADSIYLELSR
ncbi:MAG: rod-binding protein [Treponema sp.]|nr:rod-binding protein [Treponema sp.]